MKWTLLFILFACLAAVAIPCCAYDHCSDADPVAQGPGEKKDACSCSPFSICSACSNAVEFERQPQSNVPFIIKNKHFSAWIFPGLPSYYSTFWQPPRLS